MRSWLLVPALSLSLLCACPGQPPATPDGPAPAASGLPAELRPPGTPGAASERPPAGPGLPDSLKPPR